jgi:hypothetical protein
LTDLILLEFSVEIAEGGSFVTTEYDRLHALPPFGSENGRGTHFIFLPTNLPLNVPTSEVTLPDWMKKNWVWNFSVVI